MTSNFSAYFLSFYTMVATLMFFLVFFCAYVLANGTFAMDYSPPFFSPSNYQMQGDLN